ncbi:ABC transporter ATP-binding protein [Salsuginibacillus kocurii]|uniref:ABC transporter ATP-binding protein n=1 Tax=Salsuginibacillus kocurii TaxID=427078 RepID=UPI00037D9BCD|nr:ABC transporter ATP-binding protein [Salsuginibacillus kocurii]
MIQIEQVSKWFGNEKALGPLQLEIEFGEIFGFLGPSGAGKTTTIKLLTGQLLPTEGKAYVFNQPVHEIRKQKYRKKMGIMTDNSGLYQRLSIYDNLKLYCDLYSVNTRRIKDVLEMVNLQDNEKKLVSTLSKGMLQRVALARAFLHEPSLLFLDEPTAALDPVNSHHIHEGLRRLKKQGVTIFLTTHDMNEAEELCDRVAFLSEGEVKLLGTPKQLRRQFSDATITVELTDGNTLTLQQYSEGASQLYELMLQKKVVSIHTNEPNLGDIFRDVTGRTLV